MLTFMMTMMMTMMTIMMTMMTVMMTMMRTMTHPSSKVAMLTLKLGDHMLNEHVLQLSLVLLFLRDQRDRVIRRAGIWWGRGHAYMV